MGYDMSIIDQLSPAEEIDKEDARARFEQAVLERDENGGSQEAVSEAYDAMYAADLSYFRLNIWGMGEYRTSMAKLGMAHNKGDHPRFPDWNPEWNEVEDYESLPEYQVYEDLCKKARSASVEYPGIPIWKFCSNDGWIVTPIECMSALKIWEAEGCPNPDEGEPEYWLRWIDYLRRASEHGGFEVW